MFPQVAFIKEIYSLYVYVIPKKMIVMVWDMEGEQYIMGFHLRFAMF